MVNYEYRNKIANTLQFDLIRITKRAIYEFEFNNIDKFSSFPDELEVSFYNRLEAYEFYNKLLIEFPELSRESLKLLNCINAKRSRLKLKVSYMLCTGQCKFITLTFNDDKLNDSTIDSRRNAVKKYLMSLNCLYIGNIDFGGQFGREHYHFLIQKDYLSEFEQRFWIKNYGFMQVKNVVVKNSQALTDYITKFSQHGVKQSTLNINANLITSRNFPSKDVMKEYLKVNRLD